MQLHTNRLLNLLLTAGVLAGPFFMLVATIQDVTRPGFHPLRCQVSHLAIGNAGWVPLWSTRFSAKAAGLRHLFDPERRGHDGLPHCFKPWRCSNCRSA